MTVEDRLRATTEAVSASMRPVRPLDLPSASAAAPTRPRRVRDVARRFLLPFRGPRGAGRRLSGRRPAGWLVPLSAAAAVVILAAALVTVRTLAGGPRAASPAPTAPATPAGLPRYFAAVTASHGSLQQVLTVAETATGRVLFTVKPSQEGAQPGEGISFGTVSAAADDRTFAVSLTPYETNPSANPKAPAVIGWELLRLEPGGSGYTLQRLSVPALSAGAFGASALSPDGTRLAVMSWVQRPSGDNQVTLRVFAVATGQLLRAYQAAGPVFGVNGNLAGTLDRGLTWLADGTGLNFVWAAVKSTKPGQISQVTQQVRHLDLTRLSGDLLAGTTLVTAVTAVSTATGTCIALVPTADGQGAACGTWAYHGRLIGGAVQCQAVPAPLTYRYYHGPAGAYRVLATRPFGPQAGYTCQIGEAVPLWASPSGSIVIGLTHVQYDGSGTPVDRYAVGIAAGGRWTPLPDAVLHPAGPSSSEQSLAF